MEGRHGLDIIYVKTASSYEAEIPSNPFPTAKQGQAEKAVVSLTFEIRTCEKPSFDTCCSTFSSSSALSIFHTVLRSTVGQTSLSHHLLHV